MRLDKPTFVKSINMIKAYKEKLDEAYTEIENVIGDCEKLIEKVDGVDAMISSWKLLAEMTSLFRRMRMMRVGASGTLFG